MIPNGAGATSPAEAVRSLIGFGRQHVTTAGSPLVGPPLCASVRVLTDGRTSA